MKPVDADQVQVVPNFDLHRVSFTHTQICRATGCNFHRRLHANFHSLSLIQYMGGWYVYSRTDNLAEKGLKCSKDTYEMNPDGQTIAVTYTAERTYPFFWKPFTMGMTGQIPDMSQPAKQRHLFKSGPPNYFVVATDYDNYAAVYSPISLLFGQLKIYHAWVMVRDRNGPVNTELLQNAYAAIERCGISRTELVKIQQDCTWN